MEEKKRKMWVVTGQHGHWTLLFVDDLLLRVVAETSLHECQLPSLSRDE